MMARIEDLAAASGVSQAAVIAAAKILGYRRIGGFLATARKPGIDFVQEVDFQQAMLTRQDARRHCPQT
jgi:hypothetical protein